MFMSQPAVVIPEKLFFKIGEVCELAGVQAHVLRYWESEFPMLAPQKNRAGQRVYRRRDVEMALRIKELLYEDQYTIAGAKKRLALELRGGRLRSNADGEGHEESPNHEIDTPRMTAASAPVHKSAEDREALKKVATELREILALLEKQNKAFASPKK
jgi:DNA-binding transcriptional MerR regulator